MSIKKFGVSLLNKNKVLLYPYFFITKKKREAFSNIDCERKIIFIHNPKTAGTSLRNLFGMHGQILHYTPGFLVNKNMWEDFFVVTSVRNPIDRFISSYNYHTSEPYKGAYLAKYPNLKTWSPEKYFEIFKNEPFAIIPQYRYMQHPHSEKQPDFVLRFEDIEKGLDELRQVFPGELPELPFLNKAKKAQGLDRNELSKNIGLCERLKDYYKNDFEVFGYSGEG